MLLVHGFVIAWLLGGVGLVTTLLLRTERRPLALLFALIGFGGAGFVALGVGLPSPLQSAMLAAVIMGIVGYVAQPR